MKKKKKNTWREGEGEKTDSKVIPFLSLHVSVYLAAMDAQNCFEGCSSSPSSDANGNTGNGLERGRFADEDLASPHEETEVTVGSMEKPAEKKLASHATERERLVTTPAEKSEMVSVFTGIS